MGDKLSMTESELDAMRLNALINGVDLSSLSSDTEEDDDIDIEIIDDKPKKSTKRTKKETVKTPKKMDEVPLLNEYARLKNATINVTFGYHDIKYKEQLWPVDKRTVVYNIDLVKSPKISADISEKFSGNHDAEIAKARSGETRYYAIRTFENVKNHLGTIAYAKVFKNDNGNLTYRVFIEKQLLKENYVNIEKFEKNLKSIVDTLVKNKE